MCMPAQLHDANAGKELWRAVAIKFGFQGADNIQLVMAAALDIQKSHTNHADEVQEMRIAGNCLVLLRTGIQCRQPAKQPHEALETLTPRSVRLILGRAEVFACCPDNDYIC